LILISKLMLTPISIGALTLAARRWETAAGGAIAGLPLTSGPISVLPRDILLRMVVTASLVASPHIDRTTAWSVVNRFGFTLPGSRIRSGGFCPAAIR
jgi:hypothetical protein